MTVNVDPAAISSQRLERAARRAIGPPRSRGGPGRVTSRVARWDGPAACAPSRVTQRDGRVAMLQRVPIALTVRLPILSVAGLLASAEWWDRRRAALVVQQIGPTDAISAELGAVVAPVVRRGPGGAWRVDMTLPMGRPALAGRVLEIMHRVWLGRYEIRLAPRTEPIASRRHPGVPMRGLRREHREQPIR